MEKEIMDIKKKQGGGSLMFEAHANMEHNEWKIKQSRE